MSKFKNVLVFVLALVMILGSASSVFAASWYDITYDAMTNGSASVKLEDGKARIDGGKLQGLKDKTITVIVTPDALYECEKVQFSYVSSIRGLQKIDADLQQNGTYTFTMENHPVTVSAIFALKVEYDVSVAECENGSVLIKKGSDDATTAAIKATQKETVEVIATPDPGYELKSVKFAGETVGKQYNKYTFKPTTSGAVEVEFGLAEYRITLNPVSNGQVKLQKNSEEPTNSPVTATYEDTITVLPVANDGYAIGTVKHGETVLSAPYTFNPVASESVSVTFGKYYDIVKDAETAEFITCEEKAVPGATVTLAAATKDGYAFDSFKAVYNDYYKNSAGSPNVYLRTSALTVSADNTFTMPAACDEVTGKLNRVGDSLTFADFVTVEAIYKKLSNVNIACTIDGESVAVQSGDIAVVIDGASNTAPFYDAVKEGVNVQLTSVKAIAGYGLSSWKVETADGAVSVTRNTFKMPAKDVTITAIYTKAPVVYTSNNFAAENGVDYSISSNHGHNKLIINRGNKDLTVVGGEYSRVEVNENYTGVITLKDTVVTYCNNNQCGGNDGDAIEIENSNAKLNIEGNVVITVAVGGFQGSYNGSDAIDANGSLVITGVGSNPTLTIKSSGSAIDTIGNLEIKGVKVEAQTFTNYSALELGGNLKVTGPNGFVFAETANKEAVQVTGLINGQYCAVTSTGAINTVAELLEDNGDATFTNNMGKNTFKIGSAVAKTVYLYPEFTVTFDANGGSFGETSTMDVKTFDPQLKVVAPTPVRAGFNYVGWATTNTAVAADVNANTIYTANATVYAVWKEIVYTNTYVPGTPSIYDYDCEGCTEGEDCPAFPLDDVDTQEWYHEAVHFVVENELMVGYEDNTFRLFNDITRAELVTTLYRIAQKEGKGFTGSWMFLLDYTDREEIPAFAYEAVAWFKMNGLAVGFGDGSFRPNDTISREDAVRLFYAFAKFIGCDVSVGEDTNILSYDDAFEISEGCAEAFQWACGAGVIQGNNGNLEPADNLLRVENAVMLYSFVENVIDAK